MAYFALVCSTVSSIPSFMGHFIFGNLQPLNPMESLNSSLFAGSSRPNLASYVNPLVPPRELYRGELRRYCARLDRLPVRRNPSEKIHWVCGNLPFNVVILLKVVRFFLITIPVKLLTKAVLIQANLWDVELLCYPVARLLTFPPRKWIDKRYQ